MKLRTNLKVRGEPGQSGDAAGCRSLAHLRPGQRGRICAHPARGDVPPRLQELGFVPGTRVELLRRAPLGDPIELEIRGYRICLRRADLSGLCVVPEDGRS